MKPTGCFHYNKINVYYILSNCVSYGAEVMLRNSPMNGFQLTSDDTWQNKGIYFQLCSILMKSRKLVMVYRRQSIINVNMAVKSNMMYEDYLSRTPNLKFYFVAAVSNVMSDLRSPSILWRMRNNLHLVICSWESWERKRKWTRELERARVME